MRVTELVLELQAHKTKIKGVSKRLLCCYGNFLQIGNLKDTIIEARNEKLWLY